MKSRRVRRYDKERGCYVYDIGFSNTLEQTPRTLKVGEAFGLGLDTHRHQLYDDFELRLTPGDVVYITGDSGSGKSLLIDAIRVDLGDEAVVMSELPESSDVPLVDAVGGSFKEALELLSRVGLNDAYLFLRHYCELIAVMALYSPFAERAGMRLIRRTEPNKYVYRAVEALHRLGFDPGRIASRKYNLGKIQALESLDKLYEAFARVNGTLYFRRISGDSNSFFLKREYMDWVRAQDLNTLAKAIQNISVLAQSKAYLYWSRGDK